jgi:putative adenylate-forming enzyme
MGVLQHLSDLIRLNRHFYHQTPRQLARYQTRAVLELLARVRRESPFYAEYFAGYPVTSLDDYRHLPTLDKNIMMAQFDRLNTAGLSLHDVMAFALAKEEARDYLGYYRDRFVVGLSSGTSGNKGIYITDKALTRRLPGVFLARGGVRLSDLPLRILFILRVFSQGFADINAPLIRLRYLSSMSEPEAILTAMNEMKANLLMAPPSLLRQLLPLAGQIACPPRRIITYAEVLTPEEKIRLVQAFRAPVVELYQASEGQIASPCRCGNLHINEDLVYVELFAEDKTTPLTEPGRRSGRMLVTNLVNTVQPLLRYEMNDLIELGPPCPCGSCYRVVQRIIGRQDDVLYLKTHSGRLRPVYPDLFSRWIITTDDQIREFTVDQDATDHLTVTLDLTAPPAQNETRIKRLQERLAGELAVYDISCAITVRVEAIRLPADNRKLKRFISRAPDSLQ